MNPLETLIIGMLILGAIAWIVWPDRGLVAMWRRLTRRSARILLEDALKHLYDCEYKGVTGTLESIAGALSLSVDKAAKLVRRLEGMGLLTRHDTELELTPSGRSYALRVIRIHRLWERFLADETAVNESDWHKEAEKQEHVITADEANDLAKRLGNPIFDPHGDPIPSVTGELPSAQGMALTSLKAGQLAGIVHIEDEPAAIYAQLAAQRLYPGMQVRMIDQTPERVVFDADGNEIVLAPVFAANITVVPLDQPPRISVPSRTLASLEPGEVAVVTGISKACRGLQRRRLMDLGIVPGTIVKAKFRSASNDPTAYEIRGATIALRRQQAEMIFIEKQEGKENDLNPT